MSLNWSSFDSPKNLKLRARLAVALTGLAAIEFAAAVYFCYSRGFTWKLGGIKVLRLHEWDKPWAIGLFLFAVAVLLRPGPLPPARLFRRIFWPAPDQGEPASPARPWAGFGLAVGGGLGLFIALYFRHALERPTVVGLTLLIALVSMVVHGFYALGFENYLTKSHPQATPGYRSGLRSGLYVFAWLALVLGPGRDWEGRFIEPTWPLAWGFGAGLILVWTWALPLRWWPASSRARLAPLLLYVGLLVVVAARYIVTGGELAGPDGPGPERVILITLDTTRSDHLSCYGYQRPTSPRLDQLAGQGVRFDFAVCAMSVTDPSHASILSGFYPRSHGAIENGLPITGKAGSLAEVFRDRGYRTAAITSRAFLDPTIMNLAGFETVSIPHRSRFALETDAGHAFRRAANWLSDHRAENVFLWVHFFDPHQDYQPHPGFPTRFTDAAKPCKQDSLLKPGQNIDPAEVKACVDLYDGEIAYTDYWVGRLMDFVGGLTPEAGKPPLYVVVGDHGEALGEYQDRPLHYGFGHELLLYEAAVRVPLIVASPGRLPAGKVVAGPVETVDLAPTIVDYIFGVDYPCQGRSLRPLIEGGVWEDRLVLVQRNQKAGLTDFPWLGEPGYAAYLGGLKLIADPGRLALLYDPGADHLEQRDLAGLQAQVAADLAGRLEQRLGQIPQAKPGEPHKYPALRDIMRGLGYIQP